MKLKWLLYVSRSLIDPAWLDADLSAFVAQIALRNLGVGITGALIATPTHFAQYIEGPPDDIDRLLERLRHDPRHTDLLVIDQGERAARMFPHWSMAYAGPSLFVRRTVTRLIEQAPLSKARAVQRLLSLMQEFARPPHHPRPPAA